MAANDFDQPYLAVKLRRSLSYIEGRMNGRAPWSQDDIDKIMVLFRLPLNQQHVYFPPRSTQQRRRIS